MASQAIIDAIKGRSSHQDEAQVSDTEIASLQEALAPYASSSSLPPSSTDDEAPCEPLLWQRLLRAAAATLQGDDYEDEDVVQRHADEMEPEEALARSTMSHTPASRLEAHLATLDQDIAASLRSSITELLTSTSKGNDLLAAELAELIGFEQLDLVGEIVGKRSQVARALQDQQQPSNGTIDQTATQSIRPTAQPFIPAAPAAHSATSSAKPYTPGAQLVVSSAQERAEQKALRAAHRRQQRAGHKNVAANGRKLTFAEMEQLRQQELAANASRPLFSSEATSSEQPRYPHVFSSGASGNVLSVFGSKFALPAGTIRADHKEYEEVTIPPPRALPMRVNERLIPIGEMDPICRGAFPGYKSLNRLQSVVYPLGYATNENLLICAPTGAGKTDVAMLTVLRAISQHTSNLDARGGGGFNIHRDEFKIVYVAPMKALAAEIVRKFSKRLGYLGVKVRELTGDMQLTRQEIAETQMIVTTPEKWDVVTRKPGEELAKKIKLLIIDEVHLLHEDRGAVIETIVARTLRLVESSQSLIRIVGLSATLPNYVDVADFLRVNRYAGLFYFDSSFRPVPLEQHFMGVKGKPGSPQARANLDKAAFIKVQKLLEEGHQIMIFVHARKETVKSALTIREMCREQGIEDLLLAGRDDKEGQVNGFKREMMNSRNKELKELFDSGLGIHHAGMLRSDRTLSERMFETGVTKVLCCTSTLAWGVNLPAYAVLIKGTEVYDSSLGKFVDLSILDVLQIFGRAGRPQYEDLGVGYICTAQEKLTHYVDAITSQHPIESKFDKGLIDSLNAECALGTVQSIQDGIAWLSYTYLFTRMRRNPMAYGMSHDEVVDDPHLGAKRLSLITGAGKRLVACKMMEMDQETGRMTVTDLGRIAARYYIPWRTIEIFNEKLKPKMTEADVLSVLSLATDFEQIIPRDTEARELKKMLEAAPCEVPGGFDTPAGKVNTLLQAYISRVYVEDFALASDTAYVAQNTGRIIRALFEVSLSNKWSSTTSALINMSKAVERRMWPFDHPLGQSNLTKDTLFNLQRWADDVDITTLAEMPAADVGQLIHLNDRIGAAVRSAARQFPHLDVDCKLRPITSDQIKVALRVKRSFEWNERVHGSMEPFYVWIEDEEGMEIQHWSRVMIRSSTAVINVDFVLSITDPPPSDISIRWISDGWIGSEDSIWIGFDDLIMPDQPAPSLPLLELPLLPVESVLSKLPSEARQRYASPAFNALQTQALHTVLHSRSDMLLAAPPGSGKSTLAGLAIWRAIKERDAAVRVLVLVPHHRLLLQQASKFAESFPMVRSRIAASPQELAKDDRSMREEVVFALPSHLLKLLMDSDSTATIKRFRLFIAEDLHLMDAGYELALTRVRRVIATSPEPGRTRLVATSASLYDAQSLGDWLGIKELGLFSFHPKERPVPLALSIQSFDMPHSFALLKLMTKPAYDKAKTTIVAQKGPVLIFVPSRGQCLQAASDLATQAASNLDQEAFLGVDPEEVEPHLQKLTDESLLEPMLHGIGIYHEGMHFRDRQLLLDLYQSGVIKVLVAPRDTCWSIPVRAGLVILMSAKFIRIVPGEVTAKEGNPVPLESSERRTVDYPATDLLRMASLASGPDNRGGECFVLCANDQTESVNQVMAQGLPLESTLLEEDEEFSYVQGHSVSSLLTTTILQDISGEVVNDRQDLLDSLAWTYLFRRISVNPSYYEGTGKGSQEAATRLSDVVDSIVDQLVASGLMIAEPDQLDRPGRLRATHLARTIVKTYKEDWSALSTLLQIHALGRGNPTLAFAFSRDVLLSVQRHADEQETAEDQDLLVEIRDGIPGDVLAAFGIPRADRRAKKLRMKSQQEQAQGQETTQAIDEATTEVEEQEQKPLPGAPLLLAAWFSSSSLPARVSGGEKGDVHPLLERQAALVRRVVDQRRRALRIGLSTPSTSKGPRKAGH